MLEALYVLVVAISVLERAVMVVPYITIGLVASAVVHSATISLQLEMQLHSRLGMTAGVCKGHASCCSQQKGHDDTLLIRYDRDSLKS